MDSAHTAAKLKPHTAVRCFIIGAAAAVISMGTVLDRPSPFSASFTAALGGLDCLSSFLGSIIGYIISGSYDKSVIVSSALLSVMAVRMLAAKKKTTAWDVISSVTAAASVFTANIIVSHGVSEVMNSIALAVMAGGGAFAMLNVRRIIARRELVGITVKKNPVGMVSVIAVCAIAAGIASGYTIGVFNSGIILAALCSCYMAIKYGSGASAICGAAASLGIAAATGEYYYLAAVLAVSGAAAGVFSSERRLSCVGAFALTGTICTAIFTMDNTNLALMANIFAGGAAALVMPMTLSESGQGARERRMNDNSIKELFCRRLKFAEGTISEVRRTIDLTAGKLDSGSARDISWVYNTACDKVCRRCRFNMQCWGKEYGDSIKQFSAMTAALQRGEKLSEAMFVNQLYERCDKKQTLCRSLTELYNAFTSSEREKRRISGMRSVLTVQLSATEKMLAQLSEEMDCGGEIMSDYNITAREIFHKLGCEELTAVNVSVGEYGGVSLEAYSDKGFFATSEEICDAVSLGFHKRFDLPVISCNNGSYKLIMFSKTPYYLEVESYQISRREDMPCGDYFESFIDSKGRAYIVLSDGMGSGSRARIDSSFACGMLVRLLKAGLGIEASLDIINTSLMVKSADESFATLDICTVDLYSGKARLYKAGGSFTYVRSGGKNSVYGCKGLPVGVKEIPEYDVQSFEIGNKDMIVMTSDGAELNKKWLFREMEKPDPDLKEFAKIIADTAKFYAGDKSGDDISVVAMRLVRG